MKQQYSSLRLIAAGASWRLLGLKRAGEMLVTAMSADDEQTRMLAGMSLVKGGRRSFDLIEQKIESGSASASLLRLLPDIAPERSRCVLERVAAVEQGALREAAEECVDLLDRIDNKDQAAGPTAE